MFGNNPFLKKDSLVEAVRQAQLDGELRRQAEAIVNEELGVYSRNAVIREHLEDYDAYLNAVYEDLKEGKMADKDYDKDGKIESSKDEVWGSRLRAAKMAGKMEEEQIDELSDELVSRYHKKAVAKIFTGEEEPKTREKGRMMASQKRYGGTMNIKRAKVPATVKEEEQIDEITFTGGRHKSKEEITVSTKEMSKRAARGPSTGPSKEPKGGAGAWFSHKSLEKFAKMSPEKKGKTLDVAGEKFKAGIEKIRADLRARRASGADQPNMKDPRVAKAVQDKAERGMSESNTKSLYEKAPPGAKYERMVKHIKKGYSEDDGMSKKEKGWAYATAWKAYNKKHKGKKTVKEDSSFNSAQNPSGKSAISEITLPGQSFRQAFAAARTAAKSSPGGASAGKFTWQGKQYQTNVAGEKYVPSAKQTPVASASGSVSTMPKASPVSTSVKQAPVATTAPATQATSGTTSSSVGNIAPSKPNITPTGGANIASNAGKWTSPVTPAPSTSAETKAAAMSSNVAKISADMDKEKPTAASDASNYKPVSSEPDAGKAAWGKKTQQQPSTGSALAECVQVGNYKYRIV